MSHEIVKGIKIKDNKVYIKADSNNVYPKDFTEREWEGGTRKLINEGQQALEIWIMAAYEQGNFQGGSNKYTSALLRLRHDPEYKNFDWRLSNYNKDCPIQKNRNDKVLYDSILLKALTSKSPKDKFIITKDYNGTKVYGRRLKRLIKWRTDPSYATVFKYEKDAISEKSCFTGSDNWNIEKVK